MSKKHIRAIVLAIQDQLHVLNVNHYMKNNGHFAIEWEHQGRPCRITVSNSPTNCDMVIREALRDARRQMERR